MGDAPAVAMEGLSKSFGRTRALAGLDLRVSEGTVYGLLGPNGAGKTTAVRVLATLLRPDAGRATVMGHDVVREATAVRKTIGLTGQYAALDEYLSGKSNLVMIGELGRLTARAARRRADELLHRFDLADAAARPVKTYSGGMRRRLDLAASLITRPSVLFLDEPTTGLDPNARVLMWDIVRQLVADGTTLLLTTQYLDEADQLANRIAVIDAGKVIAEGTPSQLKDSVGGVRLMVGLADPADGPAAAQALAPLSTKAVVPSGHERVLEFPVATADGLATKALRALDAAGIVVNDISIRTASLDDVFLTLTGHEGADTSAEPAEKEKGGEAA